MRIMRKYAWIFANICGYAHRFTSAKYGAWPSLVFIPLSIDLLFAPQESHHQAGLASLLQRKWSQTTASSCTCFDLSLFFIKDMIGMKTWWIDTWQRSTQVETPLSHSICGTTCDSQGAFHKYQRSDLKSNIEAGCLGRHSLIYVAAAKVATTHN